MFKKLQKIKYFLRKNNMQNSNITIDAKNQILGRISTKVASILRGKDQTNFAYNKIPDIKVTVYNAKHIKVTGTKENTKKYYRHSGYLGNLKEISYQKMMSERPSFILKNSIKNMLPKNRLQAKLLNNLTIFDGEINA